MRTCAIRERQVYDEIHRKLGREELYRRTGAMTIQINPLAQL